MHVPPRFEIALSGGRERRIDLDPVDAAARPGQLGENCGEVARPRADLQHPAGGGDLEPVEMAGPQAGLTGIEAACFVERDQDIVVEAARIVVRRGPVAVEDTADAPRSRAHEALARHGGERGDDTLVVQIADRAKIFGEPTPHLVQGGHTIEHDQSLRTCIWIGPSARPWMNWSTWASPEWSISAVRPCQISRPS